MEVDTQTQANNLPNNSTAVADPIVENPDQMQ